MVQIIAIETNDVLAKCVEHIIEHHTDSKLDYHVIIGFHNGDISTGICSHSVRNTDEFILSRNARLQIPEDKNARCSQVTGIVPVGLIFYINESNLQYYQHIEYNIWLSLEKMLNER